MSKLEQLPDGWASTTLGELGNYVNGRSYDKKEWATSGRPVIRIQDLTGTGKTAHYYNGEIEEKHIVRHGDLLVSWAATLDAFIYNGPEGCLNQHIFRVDSFIDKRFHRYLVQSVLADLNRQTHGSGIVHITRDKFNQTPVNLPPLTEQRRIVAAIEEQFTRLDAGVAALKSARARLKQYRAAVLKAAVEGELTKAWRETHPDTEPASELLARILAERRARWEAEQRAKGKDPAKERYQEPSETEPETLPDLPEGWSWATIEQLASSEARSLQSGPFGSALLHSEFRDTGVLAIGIDNVLEGRFSIGKEHRISGDKYLQLGKFSAKPLDVLITVMATVGRCCVVPTDLERAIITKHVYRISVDQRIINPYYLMMCLWGGAHVRRQLFGQVQGQTRPGINGEILRRIAIPVGSIDEQRVIVDEVERRLSVLEGLQESVEAGLKRAERLRQSILTEAFAGRLVPQYPNDEPAGDLLARILQGEREEPLQLSLVVLQRDLVKAVEGTASNDAESQPFQPATAVPEI